MSLEIGLKGRAETIVTEQNTAEAIGSGLVPVFGTPYMIALMENAAVNAIQPCLTADEGSVGTLLNIAHSSATPIGMKVWANAAVTAVDGKKIGHGIHERFIIKPERFLAKAQGKLDR